METGQPPSVPLLTLLARAQARYPGDDEAAAAWFAGLLLLQRDLPRPEERLLLAGELFRLTRLLSSAAAIIMPPSDQSRAPAEKID